ncbi:MAG: ATP-binding protein [Clostridiales bacterium]|nr:ATP-binding protein [Clostridiales bacterium]
MSYSQRIFELATLEYQRRREKAHREQEQRHSEAVAKLPRLIELGREMSETGLAASVAIAMGADAQKQIAALAEKNLAAQKERRDLLRSAGYPDDFLEPRYHCDLCEDMGVVDGIFCQCREALLRSIAFSQLSELSPVEDSTFENFDLTFYPNNQDPETGLIPRDRMKEIYDYCLAYAKDFDTDSPSLFMHGKTGLGKTHLSLAIAGYVVNKGFGVIYGSAQNLLTKLEREKFSRNTYSHSQANTEESLLDCDLLVLDDLGAEFSTAFTVAAVYNIINTRISRGLPVIISTNLTPEELEEKYTQRITSRIIGNYTSLRFHGRDIRQLKKRR